MNTTTDTPRPEFTTAQRRAALAWIERDGASLRQVAAQLDLAPDDLLDILAQPHVAAYIEAAENLIQIRTNILARYDDIDARQSLVEIAKNPEADHTTRLRAAITILQGPPPRRAAPATGAPAPGGPAPPGGPRPDRSTNTRPDPIPTSAPSGGATPPCAQADSFRAGSSPPAPLTNHTTTRLTRAAGAPFARHDPIAAECNLQPAHGPASPATSGLPP